MSARRATCRRRFLGVGVGGAAALTLGATAAGCSFTPRPQLDVAMAGQTRRPLTVPPLAPSTRDPAGRRVFELTAAASTSTFRAGQETPTWGFNGSYLGPTLRARRGEEVLVRFTNALDETTTVHWHGMHLPVRADGGPRQPVDPGRTWEPRWRIDQRLAVPGPRHRRRPTRGRARGLEGHCLPASGQHHTHRPALRTPPTRTSRTCTTATCFTTRTTA